MSSEREICIRLARQGYAEWADKPSNEKWVRHLQGTPIPNDLIERIAEVFAWFNRQQEARSDS